MKVKDSKTKAHQRYKLASGQIVPGVTTIIDELGWNKRVLLGWTRREAMAGNDPDKIKDEAADIGTLAHYLCECDAKGTIPDTSGYSQSHIDLAENCFIAYLDWKESHGITNIIPELSLVSEIHKYGGQTDMICEGKRLILGDIKTSSGIYAEAHLQGAGYFNLAIENGYPVEEVWLLHLKKNGQFVPHQVIHLDRWFEVFKHCLATYDLHKEVLKYV